MSNQKRLVSVAMIAAAVLLPCGSAKAIFGVGDQSFTTVVGDIPRAWHDASEELQWAKDLMNDWQIIVNTMNTVQDLDYMISDGIGEVTDVFKFINSFAGQGSINAGFASRAWGEFNAARSELEKMRHWKAGISFKFDGIRPMVPEARDVSIETMLNRYKVLKAGLDSVNDVASRNSLDLSDKTKSLSPAERRRIASGKMQLGKINAMQMLYLSNIMEGVSGMFAHQVDHDTLKDEMEDEKIRIEAANQAKEAKVAAAASGKSAERKDNSIPDSRVVGKTADIREGLAIQFQ